MIPQSTEQVNKIEGVINYKNYNKYLSLRQSGQIVLQRLILKDQGAPKYETEFTILAASYFSR